MLKNARKRIENTTRRNRKIMLFLGVFLASTLVGIVGAAVYNSMYMQSNIGVESAIIFLCY